jgi:hypothetical protein
MKKKLDRPVLAEGEMTGHAHMLDGEVDVYDIDMIREFTLKDETRLVHEEHETIEIPPGEYQSDTAVEYDHFAEEAKKVRD